MAGAAGAAVSVGIVGAIDLAGAGGAAVNIGVAGAIGLAGDTGVSDSVGTVAAVAAAEAVGFAAGRDDTAGFSEAGGNAPVFARRVAIARKSSSSAVAVRAPG